MTPDFYMTDGGECRFLAEPRACWSKERFSDSRRDDYLLIEVDPSIRWHEKEIREVLVSTRLQGFTLFPPAEWPIDVYVTKIVDPQVRITRAFTENQIEFFAWAVLYPDMESAQASFSQYHE